ncbi:MAG TPA: DinB family protein [Acidobacteriaceae bacterium]|nr:DinB family protein [Acidobacteriaceae bacterium]
MTLTIYDGKDFARQFRVVRNNTLQIAEDIPESKYGFVPAPNCRTVAALLTHIAVSPRIWFEIQGKQRVKTLVGFDFAKLAGDVKAQEARNRSKAEILDLLRAEGEKFAGWLDTLTPEFLEEVFTLADNTGTKSRFEQLLGAKEHEMHHRGQLMLIERQLGIVPHLTSQAEERQAQMAAARG